MKEGIRGRGRGGRGGGGWRNPRMTGDQSQQQWKMGSVSGAPPPDVRHFHPREPRRRPEREAESLYVTTAVPGVPHRRRQQGFRKERAAPYESRGSLHKARSQGPVPRLPPGVDPRVSGPGECISGSAFQASTCGGSLSRSVYADQLIDYDTGKICPRRFGIAFREVSKMLSSTESAQYAKPSGVWVTPRGHPNISNVRSSCEAISGANCGLTLVDPIAPPRDFDDMSEVSQVEEGELDDEGMCPESVSASVLNVCSAHQSSGSSRQDGGTSTTGTSPHQSLGAEDAAKPAAADGEAMSPTPGCPQYQQPTPAPRIRDPRLAARARAEALGQESRPSNREAHGDGGRRGAASPQSLININQEQSCASVCTAVQSGGAPVSLPAELQRAPLTAGKLPLLLDLDNTLLHAQAVGAAGYTISLEDWLDENGLPEVYRFELPWNRKNYYLKLRPGLRRFLSALAPFYELSIYTNATREYADLVVAILDPDRSLFADRIVARDSSGGVQSEYKTVKCLYGDLDRRCVVAFDDRQNIWTDLPVAHVVKAQHYDFFDTYRPELLGHYPPLPPEEAAAAAAEITRQRPSVLERPSPFPMGKNRLPRPYDWDRHMMHMVGLFLQLHREFFKDPVNANVGSIVSSIQSKALAGVGLFLTGYRKTYAPGVSIADCEERQTELAQRLGAKVYRRYDDPGVTHVLAGKSNTNNMLLLKDKQFQHLKKVHTLWLFSCEAMWAKAPEANFDADALCNLYDNLPPSAPFKDHWMHLADFTPPVVATRAVPFPPKDRLPTREFLATGPYSDGATLTSPFEDVVFVWRPEKQQYRQLYLKSTQDPGQSRGQGAERGLSHQTGSWSRDKGTAASEGRDGVSDFNNTNGDGSRQDVDIAPFCNFQVYAV